MDLAKRLATEIERHNELVTIRDEAQARAAQAEAERQVVRGRIEVLNELSEPVQDETPPDESSEPEKDS